MNKALFAYAKSSAIRAIQNYWVADVDSLMSSVDSSGIALIEENCTKIATIKSNTIVTLRNLFAHKTKTTNRFLSLRMRVCNPDRSPFGINR